VALQGKQDALSRLEVLQEQWQQQWQQVQAAIQELQVQQQQQSRVTFTTAQAKLRSGI